MYQKSRLAGMTGVISTSVPEYGVSVLQKLPNVTYMAEAYFAFTCCCRHPCVYYTPFIPFPSSVCNIHLLEKSIVLSVLTAGQRTESNIPLRRETREKESGFFLIRADPIINAICIPMHVVPRYRFPLA